LHLARRNVEARGGDIWVAATDIFGVDDSRILAKGQQVEIVGSRPGENVSVVDTQGNHYRIREMLLDPHVEASPDMLAEPSLATNSRPEEPAALNSTSSVRPSEIYEHLRNLGKLQEEGILSEEEFQAK
jgi:hypothetical protein